MSDKPAVTIDLSGMPCPAPLLGAKKIIDDLQPGQTMMLLSDCPGTADDLLSWAKVTGNELVSSDRQASGKTAYVMRKAGGAAKPVAHVTLDMRGVSCPGPIVEAKKLLDGMQAGEVLLLVSDCPGAVSDVNAWSRSGSADLIASRESTRGVHEFFLQRK